MTDETEEFFTDLLRLATPQERLLLWDLAVRAGTYRQCECGEHPLASAPRCRWCGAWKAGFPADRYLTDLIETIRTA